jgi:nucleosome assembly protein 1-like 1
MENLSKILPEGMQFDFNNELQKANEKRKQHLENLTEEQKLKLESLKKVQKEVDTLKDAQEEELQKVTIKYQKLKAPVFEKRTILVNGDSKDTFNGIPNFWLHALKNADIFDELNKKDEDSLKYLTNVTSTDFSGEDGKGFTLEFHYRENPYFENKVLSKKFYTEPESEDSDLKIPKGTEIEWKEGKDLTSTFETKKKKHKGGGKPKIVKTKIPCASFYNFFNSISEEELDGIDDEEEMQAIEEEMDQELVTGETVRDELIPKAISYYTGEIDARNPLASMFSGLNIGGEGEEGEDGEDGEEGGVRFQELEGGQQGDNKECENQQQ